MQQLIKCSFEIIKKVLLMLLKQLQSTSTSVSYCMICASVWKVNPRALADEVSPIQTQNHPITCIMHHHALALCALRDI